MTFERQEDNILSQNLCDQLKSVTQCQNVHETNHVTLVIATLSFCRKSTQRNCSIGPSCVLILNFANLTNQDYLLLCSTSLRAILCSGYKRLVTENPNKIVLTSSSKAQLKLVEEGKVVELSDCLPCLNYAIIMLLYSLSPYYGCCLR